MLPGIKTMLFGDSGAGKTTALRTAIAAGLEVRAIFTEPNSRILVGDIACDKGLHWVYIPPSSGSWEEMTKQMETMTKLSWEAASKNINDPYKTKYTAFYRMYAALGKYKCDRCGKEFGDASTWGTNVMLWLDSLSGINHAAMQMVAGNSVVRSQPQWGAAMSSELGMIDKILMDTICHFTLVAHADRAINEITGMNEITPLALGRANRGEYGKNFSDIIYAKRITDQFMWTTIEPNINALKATHLPWADKQKPDFGTMLAKWKEHGGVVINVTETK